jgi:hypothetical protein
VAPEDRAKLKAIEKSSFRIQGLVELMIRGWWHANHPRKTELRVDPP